MQKDNKDSEMDIYIHFLAKSNEKTNLYNSKY